MSIRTRPGVGHAAAIIVVLTIYAVLVFEVKSLTKESP
jgi:hypothetical protein